ncbi:DUF1848 domain-containing protein [Eubacteriales bacterium mix99]|jgi:hypothetical protein|nr:hypothetical protein [Clostridiales bacterium]
MIVSASRRTDIPAYYSDWFYNRIREGYVLVRNPMNFHQISRIRLAPDVVDGIVFWTKNPVPMLDRLAELRDYMYCFQFTITPYGRDIEPNLPDKPDTIISSFRRLSDTIGADRVIWRYDPILISKRYPMDYHIHAFDRIVKELKGYTKKVIFSFIDKDYRGVQGNLKEMALLDFPPADQMGLSAKLAEIAHSYDLEMDACAESIDLRQYGIGHARCIDDRLFTKLLGFHLNVSKDRNQRPECDCVTSMDIGMYNTCKNGCRYCYANYNKRAVDGNVTRHNPKSPLISGEVGRDDRISNREVKSCRDTQMRFFG